MISTLFHSIEACFIPQRLYFKQTLRLILTRITSAIPVNEISITTLPVPEGSLLGENLREVLTNRHMGFDRKDSIKAKT